MKNRIFMLILAFTLLTSLPMLADNTLAVDTVPADSVKEKLRGSIDDIECSKSVKRLYKKLVTDKDYNLGSDYKYSGGVYKVYQDYEKSYNVRFSSYKENYCDPYVSCLSAPHSSITLTLSSSNLRLIILEEIQVDCGFDANTGLPTRPDDPITVWLGCRAGTHSFKYKMNGYERDEIPCHFVSSCTHSIYQTRRRGRADDYAPWRIRHKQTVTLNLSRAAMSNKITKKQLAMRMIYSNWDTIPTNETNDNGFAIYKMPESVYNLFKYFVIKKFDIGYDDWISEAKIMLKEVEKAIDNKDYKKAVKFLRNVNVIVRGQYVDELSAKMLYLLWKPGLENRSMPLKQVKTFINAYGHTFYGERVRNLYKDLLETAKTE